MMTDPIADMLIRIKNASRAGRAELGVPHSRVKFEIAKILEREGYLNSVSIDETKRDMTLGVNYEGKRPLLRDVHRLSKPGRRLYVGWQDIPRVMSGLGITLISTSQGIMTGGEARKRKLGGELLCEVY